MLVKRRLNWKPDLPDKRDLRYSLKLSRKGFLENAPSSIDLRDQMPPVVDQGEIGSCTANAIAGVVGFLELKEITAKAGSAQFGDLQFDPVSRLFIYWNERVAEGDPSQDGGAQIRDGIKSIQQIGVCKESTWNYNSASLFTEPPSDAFQEASNHKITTYERLYNTDIRELKHCLGIALTPFAGGITVYDSFMSEDVAESGQVPMPDMGNETVQGGHAVSFVGYDDDKEVFIARNSWGPSWGMKGYFSIPYAYITDENLADDYWALTK